MVRNCFLLSFSIEDGEGGCSVGGSIDALLRCRVVIVFGVGMLYVMSSSWPIVSSSVVLKSTGCVVGSNVAFAERGVACTVRGVAFTGCDV